MTDNSESAAGSTISESAECRDLLNRILSELEEMKQIKLVAGENISISETEAGILISAAENQVPDEFRKWVLRCDDKLKEIKRFSAGRGLVLEETPLQYTLHLREGALPGDLSGNAPVSGAGGFPSDFPFQLRVEKNSIDNALYQVSIGGTAGRISKCKNLLFRGSEPVMDLGYRVLGIRSSSWISLKVYYDADMVCRCTLLADENLPVPETDSFLTVLGYVEISADGVQIRQYHFGNLHVSGRIV